MLNEQQITDVWKSMIAAETRALYFADLARKNTVNKQWVTGITFILASGAAVSVMTKVAG